MPGARKDSPPIVGERRASEASTEAEISRMIQETDDPMTKGMLLILLKMSGNLTENTNVTKGIALQLTQHEDKVSAYMENGNKLVNRGTGAWAAVSICSVVVWSLGGYIANGILNDVKVQADMNNAQAVQIQGLKGEIGRIEGILTEHLRQATPMMQDLRDRGISK